MVSIKDMKKILGRLVIVLPAIALQLLWYVLALTILDNFFAGYLDEILGLIFTVLAVFFVTAIVGKRDESTYKILWIIIIVGFPVFGAILYFFVGNKKTGRKLNAKIEKSRATLPAFKNEDSPKFIDKISADSKRVGQTIAHLSESSGFPVFENNSAKYYAFGEQMFADMCKDLQTAEKFIFVEYFIVQEGKFWNTLVDILQERAQNGVDVRVMYDDLGSIGTYSPREVKKLLEKGIKCIPFNPFFLLKSQLNNRDHRKIMVIDSKIAYSGGVNLADEYINHVERFGVWKDIGFRITGKAVESYTYMFVEFWNAFSKDLIPVPPQWEKSKTQNQSSDGFIIPYYDSPSREEHTSNVLFTEVLSLATDYAWFYTPYLILGDSLFDAFIRAAERGVDVRIIMPGIPDKKMVFRLSRSYYRDLLKAGVKIYEYTPGFVHAKAFIADDILGGIGTVNLDYRSLFLHFECESVFYKASILKDLKEDFLNTQSQCKERKLDDHKETGWHRFGNNLLRVIAPLL